MNATPDLLNQTIFLINQPEVFMVNVPKSVEQAIDLYALQLKEFLLLNSLIEFPE